MRLATRSVDVERRQRVDLLGGENGERDETRNVSPLFRQGEREQRERSIEQTNEREKSEQRRTTSD